MNIKIEKRNTYGKRVGIVFIEPSKTQQQFKDECDVVNNIKKLSIHLNMTGESLVDNINKGAMYGDFTQIPDFVTYNNIVCDAKEKFDSLDPKIKQRFHNSPTEMFDFLLNSDNKDEAIKLGLVNAPIQEIKEQLTAPDVNIEKPVNGSSAAAD